MLPWIGIQDALTRSANSVLEQGHLVKKLAFPTESLVIAALSSAMLVQALGILQLLVWTVASGRGHPNAAALALAFAFEALLLLGPAFALAAANVFLRDLAQSLGPALMVVLYMTPILYPAELVPPAFSAFLRFNPFADLIALFGPDVRRPLPGSSHLAGWALSIVIAFLGLRLFRRARRHFPISSRRPSTRFIAWAEAPACSVRGIEYSLEASSPRRFSMIILLPGCSSSGGKPDPQERRRKPLPLRVRHLLPPPLRRCRTPPLRTSFPRPPASRRSSGSRSSPRRSPR
jgi:hypothetical protein